jgi:hypothetical protein
MRSAIPLVVAVVFCLLVPRSWQVVAQQCSSGDLELGPVGGPALVTLNASVGLHSRVPVEASNSATGNVGRLGTARAGLEANNLLVNHIRLTPEVAAVFDLGTGARTSGDISHGWNVSLVGNPQRLAFDKPEPFRGSNPCTVSATWDHSGVGSVAPGFCVTSQSSTRIMVPCYVDIGGSFSVESTGRIHVLVFCRHS